MRRVNEQGAQRRVVSRNESLYRRFPCCCCAPPPDCFPPHSSEPTGRLRALALLPPPGRFLFCHLAFAFADGNIEGVDRSRQISFCKTAIAHGADKGSPIRTGARLFGQCPTHKLGAGPARLMGDADWQALDLPRFDGQVSTIDQVIGCGSSLSWPVPLFVPPAEPVPWSRPTRLTRRRAQGWSRSAVVPTSVFAVTFPGRILRGLSTTAAG